MPKNTKGGNKAKKGKNMTTVTRDLVLKSGDEQVYALVTKMLGDCRVRANCSDGIERVCHIRGKMRKRVWINPDDVILVSLRVSGGDGSTFDVDKADVIHKYTSDEAKKLKRMGEYNESMSGDKVDYGNADGDDGAVSDDDDDVEFDFDEI